jgi:hypothetical protein
MDKGPVAGRKVWTRLAQGFGRGEHKAAAGAPAFTSQAASSVRWR